MISEHSLATQSLATPSRNRGPALLLVAGCALALSACASNPNQQVWTTKNQSMLGVKTDSPSLNVDEQLPLTGSATSASELREPAISLLLKAAESTSPLLRANAIEALHSAPDQLEPIVQRGLGDENRGVRFVAAMTAGKLKMTQLSALLPPLLHDESQSVQAAALYAMRRCGHEMDLNPLAKMLLSNDPEVKGNAALVLGELGDRSAIPLLREAAGHGLERVPQARRKIVELQIAEAMVKLGSTQDLDVIRAALFAPMEEGELAALACQLCGELRDGAAVPDMTNIIHREGKWARPPEIRMAAARAIALIDPSRDFAEVPAAYAADNRAEIRAQAASTFGAMRAGGTESMAAVANLSRLMNDANPLVQVAAAGAILQIQQRGSL